MLLQGKVGVTVRSGWLCGGSLDCRSVLYSGVKLTIWLTFVWSSKSLHAFTSREMLGTHIDVAT